MLKQFLPEAHAKSILSIVPEKLKHNGIKALIIDLDNTLVAWNERTATPELARWFLSVREAGISVMIVSNNSERRVSEFARSVGIAFIYRARKPLPFAFRRAMRMMRVTGAETMVIGDQLMTDILGGNQVGAHTIFVAPIADTDGWLTKMNRRMERFIFSQLRRKGWMKWEK